MAKEKKLETASVLAFERKLDVSDALFYAGKWDNIKNGGMWKALDVKTKSVRGTISNRLGTKTGDNADKVNSMVDNPNLQTVDVVTLPADADTLKVRFTLRVIGGVGTPSACNKPDYKQKLMETVDGYVQEFGFKALAERYAINIANGRFLWRNRIGAEKVEVIVSHMVNGNSAAKLTFDALNYRLDDFSGDSETAKLGSIITDGLSGKGYVLLDVVAYARIGDGQEVFPSQELILEKSNAKGKKSRTLYSVDGVAGMHSQKVGNALRTIDTWYADFPEFPIAVEPYGSVTSQGCAYRQPVDKTDFYNLLDGWILKDKKPSPENQHFVMAVFIRGGVFGDAEKE
ncbi:type I-F CRISPR-associated protein Csy3 [Geovibrio thiophilus]|uniref:Type I-F CRISPR-associated protein Csy3 n=1 Tax=Geovibrio thiophilus TaxID=139438 RepID=A0A3R5XXZ5_9BACT|nr:type I-F CRISPR-associated protein Csy3 [Geovibrio thiophilus]QAR33494.1 type I-F CRISPR-associated protein Csy3 [Geovibrio thiophilus]